MADFNKAVAETLVNEGGYVNNPNDSGGPTKYGITQDDLPGIDIKTITEDVAIKYYSEHYWKPMYGEINDQIVASKIFDMGVLFGVGIVTTLVQAGSGAKQDGAFGPKTLAAVNAADPGTLLQFIKTALVQYALRIVTKNPKDREFFAGWVKRINS